MASGFFRERIPPPKINRGGFTRGHLDSKYVANFEFGHHFREQKMIVHIVVSATGLGIQVVAAVPRATRTHHATGHSNRQVNLGSTLRIGGESQFKFGVRRGEGLG